MKFGLVKIRRVRKRLSVPIQTEFLIHGPFYGEGPIGLHKGVTQGIPRIRATLHISPPRRTHFFWNGRRQTRVRQPRSTPASVNARKFEGDPFPSVISASNVLRGS